MLWYKPRNEIMTESLIIFSQPTYCHFENNVLSIEKNQVKHPTCKSYILHIPQEKKSLQDV